MRAYLKNSSKCFEKSQKALASNNLSIRKHRCILPRAFCRIISNSLWILFEITMRKPFDAPERLPGLRQVKLDRESTRKNGRSWLTDIIPFNLIARFHRTRWCDIYEIAMHLIPLKEYKGISRQKCINKHKKGKKEENFIIVVFIVKNFQNWKS